MIKEENSDIKALKEWALGTEFDRKKGFNYKFDAHVENTDTRLCKIEDKSCIMENQLNTLMLDRNRLIAEEMAKKASKLAFRKFLSAVTLGLIKLKTGV